MNIFEMGDVMSHISYKDNWRINIFKPLTYSELGEQPELYLQVSFLDKQSKELRGRKWRLSEHMTKSELVQTALMAVLAAEEHEAREAFKYRGAAIFGPHFDVDALHELARGRNEDRRHG